MKHQLRLIFVLIPFFCLSFPGMLDAQVSQGGVPRSFALAMTNDASPVITVASPSVDVLQNEDELNPIPYRFALNIPVDLGIVTAGNWSKAPDGTSVWRLTVESAGALALTLYFDRFKLPEGGKLFVYNPGRTQLIGAFTSENNSKLSTFATELIYGDKLTLEYDMEEGAPLPELHISEVAYAYRGISVYSSMKTGFGGAGKCEVNINCAEGDVWQKQKKSVVRVQIKRATGDVWCTGSMVNNTRMDGKPYFLTADHCGTSSTALEISQWIFYFNYEGTGCPNPTSEPTPKTLTGGKMLAHGGNSGASGSDFFLVLLNSNIPASYNVYYNGWSRETVTPSPSGVGIHHPEGDIKKISTYTDPLVSSSFNGGSLLSHWMVKWSGTAHGHGTTEGGSSGSPIFDNLGRLVGTLTGGESSCDSANLNSPDYYGQFAYSWDKNGYDSINVLKFWLDPTSSNVMTLNGWALGVDEPLQPDWVTVYPNPVAGNLYFKTTASSGKKIGVIVYDTWGRRVFKNEYNNVPDQECVIDMTELASGMYLVKISDGERQYGGKIIKQ